MSADSRAPWRIEIIPTRPDHADLVYMGGTAQIPRHVGEAIRDMARDGAQAADMRNQFASARRAGHHARGSGTRGCGDPLPPGLKWVIAGCESGPGARPASVGWFRSLRDQCKDAGVPFFLKQAVEVELSPGTCTSREPISAGPGSHCGRSGPISLPYLDGVQHAAFPGVTRG